MVLPVLPSMAPLLYIINRPNCVKICNTVCVAWLWWNITWWHLSTIIVSHPGGIAERIWYISIKRQTIMDPWRQISWFSDVYLAIKIAPFSIRSSKWLFFSIWVFLAYSIYYNVWSIKIRLYEYFWILLLYGHLI